MPRQKRHYEPVQIMVRVHPDTAAWVDGRRGDTSRGGYVRQVIERERVAYDGYPEIKPATIPKGATVVIQPATTEPEWVPLGRPAAKPGSLLKKR